MQAFSANPVFTTLTCLALSPTASAIAGEAVALNKAIEGKLQFLSIGPDNESTRSKLSAILAEHGIDDPEALIIRPGKPEDTIQTVAEELKPDMVMLGALEHEGLVQSLFGSVARRVVRKVPRPVMLLADPIPEGTRYQSIVVCIRLDDTSRNTVRFGLRLAHRTHARFVHFVYEYDYTERLASMAAASSTSVSKQDMHKASMYQLSNYLEEFSLRGLDVQLNVLHGSEGFEAVEYARRKNADLLIYPAPSRPLGFWDRFLLHPAEVVIRRLPCTVLIHRDIPDLPPEEG